MTREATTTTNTARGARGAVEISNWQTNFPAVCQGVANSVSYIMEQEFYCFRKFQHISPCSFDRRPPPSPMLGSSPATLAVAVASTCQGLPYRHTHVSLSQLSAQLLLHHIRLHTQTDTKHTHSHTHPVGNYKADRWIKQPQSTFRQSAAGFQVAYVMCH